MTAAAGQAYRDGYFTSQDGLRLHYRDYGDPAAGTVAVLCLAGLTRNSRDFDALARHLAPRRRVLALDYRGRGLSASDPDPGNYRPETLMSDIGDLLTLSNCHHVVVVGTSLGGVLAMGMGAARPMALAGVVLNDVGPEIDTQGLDRIRAYVGREAVPESIEAGARQLAEMVGPAYPDFTEQDWLAEARARYRPDAAGKPGLEYDPSIARPLADGAHNKLDLWRYFRSLARVPVLAIRGDLSDILSEATLDRMAREKPDLRRLTVPNRGHVPLLSEAACLSAIDAFLAEVDPSNA